MKNWNTTQIIILNINKLKIGAKDSLAAYY